MDGMGRLAKDNKKAQRRLGLIRLVGNDGGRYPARLWASSRRARDVIPAAMRAEVRITAVARAWRIGRAWWHRDRVDARSPARDQCLSVAT
jgi:hypothetical protein